MSANVIMLRTAGTQLPVVLNGAAGGTCNIGTAGPIANGRDQAGAFNATTFIYLYFIWNGTTLASLASLNGTTPTLPSGYTHWCYALSVRTIGASVLNIVHARGSRVYYELNDPPTQRVVSSGVATTFNLVVLTSWVPLESSHAILSWYLGVTNATPATFTVYFRAAGTPGIGEQMVQGTVQASGASVNVVNTRECYLSGSRTLDYRISGPPTTGGVFIDVVGYVVPNA